MIQMRYHRRPEREITSHPSKAGFFEEILGLPARFSRLLKEFTKGTITINSNSIT